MRNAVFLDRDGVLNRAIVRDGRPFAPRTFEEFELLDEASAAVDSLRAAGFLVVVTTNQPDVGHGITPRVEVERMHDELRRRVAVDDIRVCFDRREDFCECRKPLPGMLLQAAAELGINLPGSFMVGDRWSDIEAGRAASCRTILIERSYPADLPATLPDYRVSSLREASQIIVAAAEQVSTHPPEYFNR